MLRIVEIAHGEFVGHRFGLHVSGGLSDAAIFEAEAPLEAIGLHPELKVLFSTLASSDHVHWNHSLSPLSFANTVQYPPWLYIPACIAARLGEMTNLSVNRTLYLVRATTGVVAVLLTAVGLQLARRARLALAMIAMMPMVCALNASAGQDAIMIALMLLVVGCIDRITDRNRPPSGWETAGLACALACVIMARPPYIPLALLLLVNAGYRWQAVLAVCAVCLAVGGWALLVASRVMVPFIQANPVMQVAVLKVHPGYLAILLVNTIKVFWSDYVAEFVGQLGSLDTALPHWYIVAALITLGCCFAAATEGPSRRVWLPLLAVTVATLLIFVIQYVTWTPPGETLIEGVQGRYLIPLVAALTIAVPAIPRVGTVVRPLAVTMLYVFGAITPFVTVQALVVRFYLHG